jgi:hypothetical protein
MHQPPRPPPSGAERHRCYADVFFRKSSGLEDALKAFDLATKKSDGGAVEKAHKAIEKTAVDYAKLVASKAGVMVDPEDEGDGDDNQNPTYQEALKKLIQGLNRLRNEAKRIAAEVG